MAEFVVCLPVFFLLVIGGVQYALWSHASHLARAAAEQGSQVASGYGSTPAAGTQAAQSFIATTGPGTLTNPQVVDQHAVGRCGPGDRHRSGPGPHPVARSQSVGHQQCTDPGVPDQWVTGDRRIRGDEGQAIAELVIVAPVLLIIIVLMVALGRVDSAQGDVESAARAGVQAAVVQADAANAQTQATSAVTSTLAGAGLTCPAPQITTDTSNFVAGGTVSVSVTCVTSLADVSVPGVPGSKTLSATAVAHIDVFRTVGGGT